MTKLTDAQYDALHTASRDQLLKQSIPGQPTYVDTRDGHVYAANTIASLFRRGYLIVGARSDGGRKVKLYASTTGRAAIGLEPLASARNARVTHLMANAHVQNTACGRYVNASIQGAAAPLWSADAAEVTCTSCRTAAEL